ncbi:fibronectin type III domain-containing protein [Flavobacterium sp.]|jgi:gliding motility-associated-like protein|uniref:fibronectin type III domain-containing protein n=1 Tax=Flavobacterium sp. TaxID=239 RepID=UPI0037BEDD65
MKKFTLLLFFLFISISGYSQLFGNTEGFENTTGITGPLPATWTLGTGDWAVFERNSNPAEGTDESWGINPFATGLQYQGTNCASVSREQIQAGNTSEDFLATSVISIPLGTTELRFWTRNFTSGNQGTIFKVMIAPTVAPQTDPDSYTDLQQWSELDLIVPTSNFNVWTEKVVDVSAYAGFDVYIAFVRVYTQPTGAQDGDRWLIDKVSVNTQCTTPVPAAATAITSTTASLTWTNPSGATTWEVEIVPAAGTPTGIPTYPAYSGALPFIATGLLPNTAYKYYVRAICSTGFSSPWSVASTNFTTLIAPPVCGGNLVDSGGIGGDYLNNENVTTTVNPITPGDLVTVTFTAFNTQAGSDILRIYDGPDATFPLLATLSGTTLPPSYTSSAVSGALTFVFTSNATTVAAGYAANITCAAAPPCRIPTAVGYSIASVTTNSVSLNWTQPANPDLSVASVWDIVALPVGSPAPNAATVPTANDITAGAGPSYLLTGLTPATCYDVYIRAVCATNSAWSTVPVNVCTLVAPPVCGGTFVDAGGTGANYNNNANETTVIAPVTLGDAVTLTFTAFNTQAGSDLLNIYDGPNASFPLLATLSGTTIPPAFTSSHPSGNLTCVFTSNAATTAAGWIANVTCAPPPSCATPTTLSAPSFTFNSATLSWVQPANPDTSVATSWEVLALPCNSAAPGAVVTGAVTTTTNTNFLLTPLAPNSCFDIYVRAICGATTSLWSVVPVRVNTPVAPPLCGGNFVDAGGTTAAYPANSNVTTIICPTTPGDLVTVTFTSFDTEATWDGLYVYNGNAVVPANIVASANPAANVPGGIAGSYWGNAIPGPFTSSAANGCLTFVFRSDGLVQNAGWVANVTCAPPPTCVRPTTITTNTLTSNSVVLNWTQPTNPDSTVASAWQVVALPCGSPAPVGNPTTGVIFNNVTSNPFTLTGLTPATCYTIYIRAICSVTDSSTWASAANITTLAAPPECGGNFVDAGGTTAAYPANSNVTTIICPTTPGDVVTVTFTSFNTEPNFDGLYVYNGNAVVPANIIASANPAGAVPGGIAGSYWGIAIPGPFTSTAADGCLTFVFRSDGSVQNAGWVANITCAPPPTCRIPTTITTNTLTSNSVILNWTQPTNPDSSVASAWQVVALPCGSPAPVGNPTTGVIFNNVTSNPFTLTGLTPATCYTIYIRAICSVSDSSTWASAANITTLVAPPVCGGNFVDEGGTAANYAANSNVTTIICPTNPGEIVTVTFTAFNTEANFDALYVYDGNTVTPGALIPSANPAANVPGGLAGGWWGNTIPGPFTSTTANGCLTFVFRSDGVVQNPGWVANVTCSPAPTCARPLTITAAPVTQTSAVLNWVQPPNPNGSTATAWEVLVLPAGSPVPTGPGIPVTSIPYNINGLTPGTGYVFYVRAICSPTDASIWSAFNFATLPVNDACDNATFAIVNQNLNCVQTTPGTLAGATASLPATTCGGAGAANDDVWFTFTATTVTHVISFNNVTPATPLSYAIYQGTCSGLTEVGCNTGAGLVAGTTYFIRVFSTGTVPVFTNFNLCIGTLPCTEAPAFCTGQTVTYANATNVPSLGQIGCLFTSPNPAFFFLQVNQAGPLSYLISQVSTAGVGIDVDYVAWGPFTDLNTACTGVPANPLAQTVPIPTPVTGCPGTLHACSYSTAPQEIMCIPNAQLCQVYVIMITNFSNQAGTVTFTQTNTGGGTTACFPINTFNYSQTNYCQNQPNPTPILSPGATAGVYSSTPGLVFVDSGTNLNSATGQINLALTTPGNYIITSTSATTIGGTCNTIPFITTSRTVIITAPASATIAYSAATYCNNISITQGVTRTGTLGGTYSAAPAGLLLNAITGEIIPVASTPGLYTVTYTIPATGGCAVFTTTTQVEILASPVLNQTSVAACDTYTLPALVFDILPGTVGNYYSAPGGVGTPLDINVPITSTQPVFVYATATNGCISERQFTVTINTVPTPTFTVIQSSCTVPTGSITVTAPVSAGGPLPANLFISEVTDADTGSLSYVEIYNGTGVAVNLANYKLKFYTWGPTSTSENLQCDLQLAGTIPNNSTNVIKVSNDANITGVTPNQTFTTCAGVNNNDNIRLTTATGTEIDVWGRIDGSTFTPGGQTGYTYRRLNSATIPSTTWISTDWTPLDPEVYSNVGTYSYLVSTYQYSLDSGPFQTNTTFSNVPSGPHTLVVKDVTTGCLSTPVNIVIDAVNQIPSVSTITYQTPICQNSTVNPLPDTSATGFTTGGTFTSNPSSGINLNPTTGEITLSGTTPGNYDITYTVPFDPITCQAFSSTTFSIVITNVITPVVGFSYTTPICKNAQATLTPTLNSGFTTGGVFSSTTGLIIDSATGVIDLTNSTAGPYTITYTLAGNSCLAVTSNTFDLVINPVITPVTTFTYTTPVCQNSTVNPLPDTSAAGFTTGGVFTSNPATGIDINPSTGEINLAGSTGGSYDITYTIAANLSTCQVFSSTTFTIVITNVITPVVGFSYTTPICQNAQATLSPILDSGFTTGGVFSSTTGLIIDSGTGVIDLTNSTAGPYTITYTLAGNSCLTVSINTFDIVINPVITPVTTFTYATPVCQLNTVNPLPDTSAIGFTTGGVFTSNPSTGVDINPSTGEINLANTSAGTYIISYDVAANPGICQLVGSTSFTIVINPATPAEVGFSYTTPICQISQPTLAPTLNGGFVTGGTFTINPSTGVVIDPVTGVLTLGNSATAGTYDVTYTLAADIATCRAATTSSAIQVVISPSTNANVGFTYGSPICVIAQPSLAPVLATGFVSGGTFTANPSTGITINASTGEISLANNATTPGTYNITYSIGVNTATCQNATTSAPFQVIITPSTTPIVGFNYDSPICAGETVNPTPNLVAGFVSGGVFGPTPLVNPSTGEVNLSQVSPGQQYTITYNLAVNTATCQNANNSSATISITSPILVELSGGCQSVRYILTATPQNGSFVPENATYSWINAQGVEVGTDQSLVVTVVGTYTVTVTFSGCSNTSLPFVVESVACVIQRGISVNNDNFNDTFDLTGFDVKNLIIYNRLGMQVYSRKNYVNEWGGKSDDGDELPDGTYFYNIEQRSGEVKTGWIYINRAQ